RAGGPGPRRRSPRRGKSRTWRPPGWAVTSPGAFRPAILSRAARIVPVGVRKFGVQPGAGEGPPALGRRHGHAQGVGGLRHGQAAEEAQGYEFGLAWLDRGEALERLA